jgi:hypothetical protein
MLYYSHAIVENRSTLDRQFNNDEMYIHDYRLMMFY